MSRFSPRRLAAALCLGAAAALPYAVLCTPATLVTVNGAPLGAVADAALPDAVISAIADDLSRTAGTSYTPSLSTRRTLALRSGLLDEDALRAAILDAEENTDDVAAILVDGEPVVYCASTADAQDAIDAVRVAYQDGQADADAVFLEPVAVQTMAAPADLAVQRGVAAGVLTSLVDVRVHETVSYTEAIPYETVTRENVLMDADTQAVVQEGAAGKAAVSAEIVKVNGQVTERTIVSRAVLAAPRKQIVEVGAKQPVTGAFIAPLSSYRMTSAFRSETRSRHAGVDLAAPIGSTVRASDGGTVVTAAWSGSYGYYVVIDHGHGTRTLYAHNSSLTVSAGDKVAQGDEIAKSGNTGNSSGPHVHFELSIDGENVDPALYIPNL